MEILQLLGVAIGLASLAGLNLYLTVFVTGLAIRFGWVELAPVYERLEVLADPAVLVVAGVLCAVEFIADKVPWVDSAWDGIQTAVRPVGAALLAILVLGDTNPAFNVVVALLAAGLGLTTHLVKAGVRLHANASPEPVSNVVLSLAEDTGVILGLALIYHNPVIALVVCVLVLAAIWFALPPMFRATRIKLWLLSRKLRLGAVEGEILALPCDLPARARRGLDRATGGTRKVLWSVPCIAGRGPGLPRNRHGFLVALEGEERVAHFIDHRGRRGGHVAIPLDGAEVRHHPRFLADTVEIPEGAGRGRFVFLFDRGSRGLAAALCDELRKLSGAGDARLPALIEV